MSSSLALSSPSTSLTRNWKHHVFPSFHGPDVRKAFLTHLLKEFRSKAIDPFIDNDIERSKSIAPELIEAIRGSRIAFVLLSKNYASSTWCLDELVEIIKCREVLGQIVMVLFYEVEPTDVKKQTGNFGEVFTKTCKDKTEEDIERWKQALAKVATIAGYHSRNWDNEAELIEKIVSDVSEKLNNSTLSSDFDSLVGMESHMTNMGRFLRLDSEEVRIIGILGPSGIGKTTIARFLFNQHSENFQLKVFMENIRARYPIPACSNDYSVQKNLQEQFMSQLTGEEGFKIPHLGIIKHRLKDKKVLVVLDDVDQLVQLEALAKEASWFGSGSWIIITTQDLKLLKASGINHIYKVNFPSSDEALEIFCMHAFGQKSPKDGFQELAWEVSRLADKLPLGLRVLGSNFRGMSKPEWTRALPRLLISLDGKIESILKFSYDALCDEDKKLFLHIACFFHGEFRSKLEPCLADSFSYVGLGLHVLLEKSLIYQSRGMIKMNNLLVQLGRDIVRKQSDSEPGERQFLDDAKDIDEVFSDDNADGRRVIGIDLKFSNKNKEKITCTSERAFERLHNLRFLRIDGDSTHLYFPQSLNSISRKLRFLSWNKFPMPWFPSNFHPEFLVKLEMPESKLENLWEGIQPLGNLKWMDLGFSKKLKKLPDLSTATNLESLNLSRCSSLVKLPFSIGNAINLDDLCLFECSSLVELPSSIGNATNLQKLDLSYCSSLVELPFSMKNLCKLSRLELKNCSKLEVCLSNINLESIKQLDLSNCSLLKSYPQTSTNIEDLNVSGTVIEEMPSLMMRPWPLLSKSETTYSEVQEIDPWIGRISSLYDLKLRGMSKLVSLPQLPGSLTILDASNCKSLERLECSFRNSDIRLIFAWCFKLSQEARDLIIQTRTNAYAVLPGGEVPACFTYRASGSSLTVKLNQVPLSTSAKFKACIVLAYNRENDSTGEEVTLLRYSIASKQKACGSGDKHLIGVFTAHGSGDKHLIAIGVFTEHLYTFEVDAVEVTSTELIFNFELDHWDFKAWVIKECGISLQPDTTI